MVLLGGTSGLGLALWRLLAGEGATVLSIGRKEPDAARRPVGTYLRADLSTEAGLSTVLAAISAQSYDCVVYVAGVWEKGGFEAAAASEVDNIIKTNLIAPLHIGQHLLRLSRSRTSRTNYILIGSTCGLENEGSGSAAYVSSKFGMRGLTHALREAARGRSLYTSCISPGSILSTDASAEPETGVQRIPPADILMTIRYLCSLSPSTLAKEVILPAFDDTDV